jgi:hypothetical protein
LALIEGCKDRPIEFVVDRIDPRFLPRAVRSRGNDTVETKSAANRIDGFMSKLRTNSGGEQTSNGDDKIWQDHVQCEDVAAICEHCPEFVARWLEGMEEQSEEFLARVYKAELFFLALCESLLAQSPRTGCQLWRAIRGDLVANYTGTAKVDEMLHILFRVPDSDEVAKLRLEMLDLSNCNTDKALFDLILAANRNGRADWVTQIIERDRETGLIWKQRRAEMLASFAIGNALPVPEAWPEGQLRSVTQHLVHDCSLRRWREACNRHWWDVFVESSSQEEAYGAWILFLESADRRADIQIAMDERFYEDPSELAS